MKHIIKAFFRTNTLICFFLLIIAVVVCAFFAVNIRREEAVHSEKVIAECVSTRINSTDEIGVFDEVVTVKEIENIYRFTYGGESYEVAFGAYKEMQNDKTVLCINPDNPSDAVSSKKLQKIALFAMTVAVQATLIFVWRNEYDCICLEQRM